MFFYRLVWRRLLSSFSTWSAGSRAEALGEEERVCWTEKVKICYSKEKCLNFGEVVCCVVKA